MATQTHSSSDSAFWGAMNREVGTIHAERNVGENGADQYSMYGLAGRRASELQGALVAAFAGLTRGCTQERTGEFFRNIEVSAQHCDQDPKAYQKAMATVCVLAFQTRDCRGAGKGERDLSRWLLLELYHRFPRTVEALAPLFPEYGYWRDLSLFIQDCSEISTQALSRRGSEPAGRKPRPRIKAGYGTLVTHLYQIWADQISEDHATLQASTTGAGGSEKPKLSLAAKYVPKEGRSFDRQYGCAKRLAEILYPEDFHSDFRTAMRKFRIMVSALNKAINTTECLMSACPPQWDRINFQLVPGCLLRRCSRAFLNLKGGSKCRQDETRSTHESRVMCAKNLELHLELAKQGKVKVKGKQNFIHQIVESHLTQGHSAWNYVVDTKLSQAELDLLQLQWNDHRDKLRAKIESEGLKVDRGASLIDVSGSMNGTPMMAAVSLGLMISELAPAPYGNRFLTFEESPKWVEFKSDWPLSRKITTALQAPWGGSTDFLKAMDLMLEVAVRNRLQPEQLPEWFLVASDMQFNAANHSGNGCYQTLTQHLQGETRMLEAIRGKHGAHRTSYGYGDTRPTPPWATHHDILLKAFHNAGIQACGKPYTLPRMVYWNLRGDTVGFPVQADTPNTQMLSGFSVDLLPLVLEQRLDDYQERDPPTPWDLFVKAMDVERYDPVLQIVQETGEGCFHDYVAPVRVSEKCSDGDDGALSDSTDPDMPELIPFGDTPPPTPPCTPVCTSVRGTVGWDPDQVASWLGKMLPCGNNIRDAVRREQVDGSTMEVIVQQADRESLVELGITSRLQQSRVFSQWPSAT